MDEVDTKEKTAAEKHYAAMLKAQRDYWRRKNPNPKPRGRPRKVEIKEEEEKEKELEVVQKVV